MSRLGTLLHLLVLTHLAARWSTAALKPWQATLQAGHPGNHTDTTIQPAHQNNQQISNITQCIFPQK